MASPDELVDPTLERQCSPMDKPEVSEVIFGCHVKVQGSSESRTVFAYGHAKKNNFRYPNSMHGVCWVTDREVWWRENRL